MPMAEFSIWGAQLVLKSATCACCGSTVTYPMAADGSLDTTHAPIGRAPHGTTREARATEVLASRPRLEERE